MRASRLQHAAQARGLHRRLGAAFTPIIPGYAFETGSRWQEALQLQQLAKLQLLRFSKISFVYDSQITGFRKLLSLLALKNANCKSHIAHLVKESTATFLRAGEKKNSRQTRGNTIINCENRISVLHELLYFWRTA